jgi:hypothetical protein
MAELRDPVAIEIRVQSTASVLDVGAKQQRDGWVALRLMDKLRSTETAMWRVGSVK